MTMNVHVVLFVLAVVLESGALEENEGEGLIHHLEKRQAAEDLGPIPYVARDQYAPLPYQQQGDSSSSSSSRRSSSSSSSSSSSGGGSAAAGNAASSGGSDDVRRAGRHYSSSGSYSSYSVDSGRVDSGRVEDWAASSNQDRASSSSSQAQDPSSRSQYNGGRIPGRSSGDSSSGRGRPYYQYQPPISSGPRPASHGQLHVSSGYSSQTQPSSGHNQNQNQVPSQSHVAGVTRYSFAQPQGSSSRGSRRQSIDSRTYSYPFSGRRNLGRSQVSVQRGAVAGAGGDGRGGGVGAEGNPAVDSQGAAGNQASVIGDEEPLVQVFPSERPVVNPQASQQQLLRQRELERQRRLQQLRHQQQQQSAAGNNNNNNNNNNNAHRRPPSSGGQQQRPIYTGSQPLGGNYGQPVYYGNQQQNRQVYGRQPYYGGQGQPVYGSGGRLQQPYYGNLYQQGGFDQSDYDSECPNTGIRIQINGIPCEQAVDHYGSYLCYRHEYTSRECCLRCRGLKNPARVGCEYGDHSGRCQQLQSYDCYDLRNRQSCCQSCERMRVPGARSGCEYGDMTPNCEQVRQNPGLCYIPENRYLCCETCNTVRVTDDPECPWGDQNAELCQPFDRVGNIRINCYAPPIKRICCQACKRLQDWIPMNQPGCEYGDRPVTFNTGMHRNLNCTSFMRYYGYEQCSLNQAVATNCCYTCHRYTQG